MKLLSSRLGHDDPALNGLRRSGVLLCAGSGSRQR